VAETSGTAQGAWALLEGDGQLRPTERFERTLGPLPSRPFADPTDVLRAAGFQQVDGGWQRGEERVLLRADRVPGGMLLRLVTQAEREREVRLLRIAAHDMRGPLANVRSYVGLLLGGRYTLEPRVERSLHVVRRNADKALALAEEAIDFLRLDRDGLPVEASAVPLRPALDKALQRSEDRAEPSPATRQVHVPEVLPEVWAEPDRLSRVLFAPLEHLLSRAQAGARVDLEVAPGPREVCVTYLMTPGTGMAREPFAREARILEERHLEDPVRLDVARRLTAQWGGSLDVLERPQEDARGFLLRLLLPPPPA
jgi:two-component system, OmpR family, sensor kinase